MAQNIAKSQEDSLQEILERKIVPIDVSSEKSPISELLEKTIQALDDLTQKKE